MTKPSRALQAQDLKESLAEHLRAQNKDALIEMPLARVQQVSHWAQADVFAIRRSYSPLCMEVYEVKVDRWDFLQDVRTEKFRASFPSCNVFYYATPQGLVKKEEIPEDCGLITLAEGKQEWRTVRAPKFRKIDLKPEFLLTLLFKHQEQEVRVRNLKEMGLAKENAGLKDVRVRLAWEIRGRIDALDRGEEEVKRAIALINEALGGQRNATIERAVVALSEFLSKEIVGTRNIEVARDLMQIAHQAVFAPQYVGDEEVRRAIDALGKIQRAPKPLPGGLR